MFVPLSLIYNLLKKFKKSIFKEHDFSLLNTFKLQHHCKDFKPACVSSDKDKFSLNLMMPDEYDYIIIFFLKKPKTQNYKFVLIIKSKSYCLYFQTKPYVIQYDRMNVKFNIYYIGLWDDKNRFN